MTDMPLWFAELGTEIGFYGVYVKGTKRPFVVEVKDDGIRTSDKLFSRDEFLEAVGDPATVRFSKRIYPINRWIPLEDMVYRKDGSVIDRQFAGKHYWENNWSERIQWYLEEGASLIIDPPFNYASSLDMARVNLEVLRNAGYPEGYFDEDGDD